MRKSRDFIWDFMPRTIVGLVMAVMASDALGAIANCASEYGGYCLSCNYPYVVATNSYFSVGNSMGQGTQCVLYCGEERNGNNPLDRFCDVSTSTSAASVTYTYEVKGAYSGKTCYNSSGDKLSDGSTTTTTYCSSNSYKVCNSTHYGDGNTCTYCPGSGTGGGLYINATLTEAKAGLSAEGTTQITGCYIPAMKYYDQTGTLELVSACYYSN